ncbi:hypothetical protein [Yinghuangia sp. YIM S10712]|uniref:hypothetical protein n=1 Tax=Yinghuangia sp. YIM S10712 TaxID=3436930 RepID=UPI003F52C868
MQEDQLRRLLASTADELGPTPDLAPEALRRGKQSAHLARTRNGAIAVTAAVVVLTPAALVAPVWNDGKTPSAASQYSVTSPLRPTSWPTAGPSLAPPTTAYPVVHVPPTAEDDRTPLTKEQEEVQYAYKQKAADVLQQLLPPELGSMQVTDFDLNGFQIADDRFTYPITFRIDPADAGAGTLDCTGRPGCLTKRLPNGDLAAVMQPNPPMAPNATFVYKSHSVGFGVYSTDPNAEPPITMEQLLLVVTDPKFIELVDFRIANPVLLDDGYEVHKVVLPAETSQTN